MAYYPMSKKLSRKPVVFVPPSYDELVALPREVQHSIGFALLQAQDGRKHISAKPLKGFKGAGVLEIIEDHDGNTYRAVYTVRFTDVIYVLHVFQKKSKKGIKTPKHVMDRIRARLKWAENDHSKPEGGS
jgi:phage-related protein